MGCTWEEKKRCRAVGSRGGTLGTSPLLDATTCAAEAALFFPPFLLATWAQDTSGAVVECGATVYPGGGPGVNWVLRGVSIRVPHDRF